uniref:tubulin epsilon and delta complex protein 2 n=1 Tax=Semicossyphus pulcher TaxID=241346 RepID=UPI0037E9C1B2
MAERRPDTSMSLLSVVEQAIKSCKAEQVKINNNIQLYREILWTLTPQTKKGSEESDCADDAATGTIITTGTDTSPREKEDIELLEQALEKALQVRSGTGPSKKDSERSRLSAHLKEPGTTAVPFKEGMQTSAASKGNQTSIRSTSKSAGLDRKEHKKPGSTVSLCKAAMKSQQAVSASGSLGQGQLHTSTLHSKNKTNGGNMLSCNNLGKAAAVSIPSSNNTVAVSHPRESEAHSVPRQSGIASDQIAKWKSLRSKQNRLWDKVVSVERKPVPGRSHFMERMRATFPKDWPHSCPDQTRALVDRLTHQGLDLARRCQTKELLAKQTPEAEAMELGGKKNKHASTLTHEKLQLTATELRKFAEQTTKEWEAWDRWRPEGGCLCPTGSNRVWGDGIIAPLPLTITYKSEAELRELEKLRIRVALLHQEIYLEQALLDTFSPQLSSAVPGPGCPNVSVLRDMYALLGEGGERFPAIVLDSEPD